MITPDQFRAPAPPMPPAFPISLSRERVPGGFVHVLRDDRLAAGTKQRALRPYLMNRVGEGFDEFSRVHRAVLTGQQFQSSKVDPVYILFEDFTHVKFYRRSFFDVVEEAAGPFEGFVHVDDWVPQRLVTATGPRPLPR